jgi:protease-4
LVLDLSTNFPEQSKDDPFSAFMNKTENDIPSLYDMVRMIKAAKNDTLVKGIYIQCSGNANGYAASEELRKALLDFKSSKKFVYAYGETISQKAYYVASVSDFIATHPQGGLEFSGMVSSLFFLKGMLEKLDIQPQIFYAGKFKSATEPFRYTQMSEANKLQTNVWISGLYDQFISNTARQRNLNVDSLKYLANQGSIQTAFDASKHGLVDGLLYDDQVKKMIAKKLRQDDQQDIAFLSMGDYASTVALRGTGSGKVAVVYANGDVVMGKNQQDAIASDDFRVLLQKIRKDESIDAVVLRVNSPGGSALASDIIWREIDLLKKEKPVVVSMGDLAASGGYYIACGADSIFANAGTITGSIGVFTVIPNVKGLMNNKLGISFDGVKTGQFADMPSTTRPLNAAEQKFMQSGVDSIYHTFKSRVSVGRKKSMEYIDSIAQGRVWIGADAIKIGLVDRIGTLDDAIASAAKMAKLKGYGIKAYPESKSFLESFMEEYKETAKVKAIKEEIGASQFQVFKQMKSIQQMMGVPQTRLPIFVVNQP